MFITGYGIGPTSTISGEPHVLNGSSSRSATSGSPVWKTTIAESFTPEPSGACTTAGEHGQVVRAARHRVAVEAQHVGRGIDRVGDQAAHDHLERVHAVRERGGDAEVAAAAAERPEEIRVGIGVDLQDFPVRQ